MDANTATQIVTVTLAVLAIIWHQQRTVDKLRADFECAIDKLRDMVIANGERLARIEGFLRIGIPKSAGPDPEPPPAEEIPNRPEPE